MSQELQRVLYNLSSLADLGHEVTSEKEFYDRIKSILYVVLGTFLTNKGAILISERNSGEFAPAAQKGFTGTDYRKLRSGADAVRGLPKNRPVVSGDPGLPPELKSMFDAFPDHSASVITPLWVTNQFIGVFIIGHKFSREPYTENDLALVSIIATQLAVTLNNYALFTRLSDQLEENRKLFEDMRRIYHETIQAFAAAIDAKDAYTKNHSHRVAKYSVAIARELGWDEHDLEGIYVAGYLHDVGKLIVSSDVLNKKEVLTDRELRELRSHSILSYTIISKIKFPWRDVLQMIKHHHERVDGCGYPEKIAREGLSEGVKILTIADSFDAMTSDRPYRERLSMENALQELKGCVDTQFDGKIVAAFCRVLEKEIRGELPEPNILPHLDQDFDPSVISEMLGAITEELSK
jgi:putative nucleotidyltransferase with HDIG domain